jgi:putative two-component system response regulator
MTKTKETNEPMRILVVDDDPIMLLVIQQTLLETNQYDVVTASSGEEALQIAQEEPPAMIISDYYMPGMNGFAFCQKVKSHPQLFDTIFLLLTSAQGVEHKVQGLNIGADDYLVKPFNTDELVSKVAALLRIKALQEQSKQQAAELKEANQQLEESFAGVVDLLTTLIGIHVPDASIRAERAATIARWIGERLKFDQTTLKSLEIAAHLHEIGKVQLLDTVLRKDTHELTDLERTSVSQFPVLGQYLVERIPQLKTVALILRHQLENYDGTGYPDRLMKKEIPFPSRVLRAINFLEQEAAKSNRKGEALWETFHEGRGTVLDPQVTQLLEEYLKVVENPSWLEGKKQVNIYELKEGMVIASDLCTGSGKKLLSQNTRISGSTLERILSHHQVDPIINQIYVQADEAS